MTEESLAKLIAELSYEHREKLKAILAAVNAHVESNTHLLLSRSWQAQLAA